MDVVQVNTIVALIAIVLSAFAIWQARKSGEPITSELLSESLETSTNTAQEITSIVQAGVFAAEQLKNTGQLPDNNAAFDFAYTHAKKFLPDLDRETLTTFIESSVLVANQVTAAASAVGSSNTEHIYVPFKE